ncbi:hypothetical protein Dgeo_3024 (plasmid) [Deinococcus geothermalis DSM 11300]|uniref:Uncharacterized protein n=1 Tax=Deinococcus geothermalis (strain DSM 11300 / CIP 105573 / AG-3a) TaxID=319795 RepID=A8ZRF6_DEIGD|nr:hypothetical protein [Deinococcus geothermalis]ABW35065.1 hypothetical protein Dgeo_3024 [Deinococcus geothermalis DSM 11300]
MPELNFTLTDPAGWSELAPGVTGLPAFTETPYSQRSVVLLPPRGFLSLLSRLTPSGAVRLASFLPAPALSLRAATLPPNFRVYVPPKGGGGGGGGGIRTPTVSLADRPGSPQFVGRTRDRPMR